MTQESWVETFTCQVCGGRGRVDRYADRPDPCETCGGSGEVTFEWRRVSASVVEVVEVAPQTEMSL